MAQRDAQQLHGEARAEVEEQAVRWLLKQQQGMTPKEQQAFAHWLRQPGYLQEWRAMQTVWTDTAALKNSALASQPRPTQPAVRASRWRWAWAGIASVMAVLLWFPLRDELATPIYSAAWETGRGETRQLTLPDGTALSLDAQTRVQVRYFAARREVTLEQGQAFFQVTHLPEQPFVALSGPSRVTVIGTAFRLRYIPHSMSGDGIDVAVAEGAVRVGPRDTWRNDVWRLLSYLPLEDVQRYLTVLRAAQRASSDADGRITPQPAIPVTEMASWRQSRVVFDNTRLDMALAEFARYGDVPAKALSPSAAGQRISGSFDVQQVVSFINLLPSVLPVKVKSVDNQYIIDVPARSGKKS